MIFDLGGGGGVECDQGGGGGLISDIYFFRGADI